MYRKIERENMIVYCKMIAFLLLSFGVLVLEVFLSDTTKQEVRKWFINILRVVIVSYFIGQIWAVVCILSASVKNGLFFLSTL